MTPSHSVIATERGTPVTEILDTFHSAPDVWLEMRWAELCLALQGQSQFNYSTPQIQVTHQVRDSNEIKKRLLMRSEMDKVQPDSSLVVR